MAQAIFDHHPLGDYLREVGESQCLLPGTTIDLERELDPNFTQVDEHMDNPEWRPRILIDVLQLLHCAVSAARPRNASIPFVERFKYNIISSSLLSSSLPSPHSVRTTLTIPGKLHSRNSSVEVDNLSSTCPAYSSEPCSSGPLIATPAVFLSVGYPSLSVLSLLAIIFLIYNPFGTTETSNHDIAVSFNALDELISANKAWESIVQDAVTFLKEEEQRLQSLSGPSSIRVALHSCLQTTHTQCDNIRHLFSALTSPSELSQLAEMYAPPSPIKSSLSTEMTARPFSFPLAYRVSSSVGDSSAPVTPQNKRFTWSGSYASLAEAGSPTNMIHRRREKQRAQIFDVFRSEHVNKQLASPFSGITEGLPEIAETEIKLRPFRDSYFGAAALDLQRKRKSGGLEALRSLSPTLDLRSPRSARDGMLFSATASSKFTNSHHMRHPLSSSALTSSLQGALAAKRYACAHLLALRFSEQEDEGYWEDVRSVMGLLTSTLTDASSRLSEALDEAEQQKLQEANPTPNSSQFIAEEELGTNDLGVSWQAVSDTVGGHGNSFAPVPSHLSRFAAHITAISSALDDARDHLDQCVSALKTDPKHFVSSPPKKRQKGRSDSRPSFAASLAIEEDEKEELPKALGAYERLRRELGLALRECERGRERLLGIVYPSPIEAIVDDDEDDLPALSHDVSDYSDKPDPNSPMSDAEDQVIDSVGRESTDDVTSHMLLTSIMPMPGIEEVFESETGSTALFFRERSKLSREERIKLVKAKRESGKGLGLGLSGVEEEEGSKVELERWGPGGDVVQELKDVIWKVGERRRKMSEEIQVASHKKISILSPLQEPVDQQSPSPMETKMPESS